MNIKTLLGIAVLLLSNTIFHAALALEPPSMVSLKDKVRMSTLIVVGTVDKVAIVDGKSLKVLRNEGELGYNEKAWTEIKIEKVLYSDQNEAAFYSPTKHPTTVEVVYGTRTMGIDNIAKGERLIFFITNGFDGTRFCRSPIYNWTNLFEPVDKEDEVIRIIAAFNAVK